MGLCFCFVFFFTKIFSPCWLLHLFLASSPRASQRKRLLWSCAVQLCLQIVNLSQEDKSQVVTEQWQSELFLQGSWLHVCVHACVCVGWFSLHLESLMLPPLLFKTTPRDHLVPFYRRKVWEQFGNLSKAARLVRGRSHEGRQAWFQYRWCERLAPEMAGHGESFLDFLAVGEFSSLPFWTFFNEPLVSGGQLCTRVSWGT